jgi:DNA-binding CsgD family transcriptional regulator
MALFQLSKRFLNYMTFSAIKTGIKIGIATSLAIILFQVSNIFLIYKYFKFEYYITGVAILFLVAGFFISRYKQPIKTNNGVNHDLLNNLTNKELMILQMITEGKSNKEIASENFVEISTIKTHINNIYAKLGLHSRKEALMWVKKNGVD